MNYFQSKKRIVYIILSIIGVIIVLIWLNPFNEERSEEIYSGVKKGVFEVKVFTTGELEAKNSVDIKGPSGLRSVGIWRVQISDLVDEGTKVKKGDNIASLDKSEISGKISDAKSELQQAESQYIQVKIDTTLDLRQVREELINLEYTYMENDITLKQSQYEPPATIRKAEIELEKAERALEEKKENYNIKIKQARAKMQEVSASLAKTTNRWELLNSVFKEFTIMAPEDGMVIYERDWDGKKKTAGSEIGAWDPTVATLPDLTVMISKTYVNEVDIRKVKIDQDVEITLDAFPDKNLTGKVVFVANVGEQLPNADAKVFEVKIEINETDTTLRPGMTTGNNIIANRKENALFIPVEAIHNQGDTIVFVFKNDSWKVVKQEVVIGLTNENHVIVEKGLNESDNILLSIPSDEKSLNIILVD
ncbi:MAG: efflux RND transporter periplasmic adaptor subunit [Bacteroidota bacterium]